VSRFRTAPGWYREVRVGRFSGCLAMFLVGAVSLLLLIAGLYVYAGGPLPSPPPLLH
jgi:hypothetical protein